MDLEGSSDNEVSRPPTQGNGVAPQTRHSLGHASSAFTQLIPLLPSFEAASLLVDTYFDRAHWFMLIFHQDEFRQRWPKLYEQCSGYPMKKSHLTGSLSTCLMVIAIGMHYAGSHRQELLASHGVDQSLKERILRSIRAHILDIVSLGSLEAVQTCILLGTYYLYHGAPSLAWPVCGCGLRIAQALGLHRKLEPSHDPNFRLQNETRKRCWWAIYEIETFCAVSYGYPHSIRDADCDVEPLDPSAKLPIVQPPGSFDEPLMCETTLLSYKYFMSKLSAITKEVLEELYCIRPQSADRRTQAQKSLDLPGMIKKVAYFDHRLCQWHAELPPKLRWKRQALKTNYGSVKDLDQDIGASGPRFESHIYQLQALTLMLAHGNSRILVNRPLLSYKLHTESSTGENDTNGPGFAAANPLNLSLTACRDAALSMSGIASSSIVDLVPETYAAEFVSTHTFTAGVTLGILASMDPLSPHLNGVKHGLHQSMRVQEKLKARSILAGQGLGILQRLTKLAVEKELNVLLAVSNPTEPGLNIDLRGTPEQVQSNCDILTANAVQIPQQFATAAEERSIPAPVVGSVDIDDMFDGSSFQYKEDPALSGALYVFDQGLDVLIFILWLLTS